MTTDAITRAIKALAIGFESRRENMTTSELSWMDDGRILWAASQDLDYTKVYLANPMSLTISETNPIIDHFYPDIVEKADNEFFLIGRYTKEGVSGERDSINLFLNKIDDFGNVSDIAELTYEGIGGFPSATSTSDSGMIILGTIHEINESVIVNIDFYLFKNDLSNNHIWNTTIGGKGFENGAAIIESSTGNIVFLGTSVQDGIPRITLVKTDKNGNIR